LSRALRTDPGFDVNRLALTSLNLSYGSYDAAKGRAFQNELLNQVRDLPGVASASLALLAPLSTARSTVELDVEGYRPAAGERMLMDGNFVESDYFRTMGIPLLEGRVVDERDGPGAARVAVINETMAHRFWPGQSAVGRTLRRGDERITVIGVVRDSRHFTLNETPQPFVYIPFRQEYLAFFSLVARTKGEPAETRADIAAILSRLDPNLPDARVLTMREHLRLSQFPAILAGMMVGTFGLLALTLAVIGVYGVIAYSVRKRTRELGIRAALGASRGRILSSVLIRGLWIASAGVGFGLIGSFALTPLLSQLLVDVSPRDPWVFAGVSLALTAAVLLASYIPARAAARADVLSAMR
jgi:predicted permease